MWIAALAVLLACAAAADTVSELSERLGEEPFELTADSLHYDIERELYVGRGHVVIKQLGRTLRSRGGWELDFECQGRDPVAMIHVDLHLVALNGHVLADNGPG